MGNGGASARSPRWTAPRSWRGSKSGSRSRTFSSPALHAATVTRAAVCAGAAGELLDAAIRQGAEVVVAGEMRHHDALKAAEAGVTVVCALHSNSERIALEPLRARIAAALPTVGLATSRADRDPFSIA